MLNSTSMENPAIGFGEVDIGTSPEAFHRFLESQKELFHGQVDQLHKIVVTQCNLTGVNPLAQEMAAGALSIKIGKRPRDLLNAKAVKYMLSVFSIRDTIGKKETREISALCGITVTQVRDFFSGQRSRVRQLARLSREKAVKSDATEASVGGSPATSDNGMPVSNPVPLNAVDPNDMEVPSCFSPAETLLKIDSSDTDFLESFFTLMRKEDTFSGQVKLMESILQMHNSAVLQSFVIEGGIMILATWLSEAAAEEQTTILLIIFKVLCHLPLHKALPVQMSAVLQTVNRLRFYRSSDISNRARVLLSRWSRLFVRSQALKKPSRMDLHKERIRKQRINEILSDEPWMSKIDVPEEILALVLEGSENSRKPETAKDLKLLTATSSDSSKKPVRSVASFQTRERRKVLMVEQPDSRIGRSVHVSRVSTPDQARPLSADDIQKAKMRAIFMSKYGKNRTSSSNDKIIDKNEGKKSTSALTRNTVVASNASYLRKEQVKKLFSHPSKRTKVLPENSVDLKPRKATQEPFWQRLKKDQIPWQTPPDLRINSLWRVGVGEKSKEVEVQTQRIRREKDNLYRNFHDIPSNPKEPWDVEMDFDDTLTPEIPIEQLPDEDGADASTPSDLENKTVASTAVLSRLVPNNAEPDLELLAVLLKNPELVFALTTGQGNSFTTAETVALLDKLKASGIGLPGIVGGLAANASEKHEVETSLPSPTPPHERGINWRSEPVLMCGIQGMLAAFSQPVLSAGSKIRAADSTAAAGATAQKLSLTNQLPTTCPAVPVHVSKASLLQHTLLTSPIPEKPVPTNQTIPLKQVVPNLPMLQTSARPTVLKQPSVTTTPSVQTSLAQSLLKQLPGAVPVPQKTTAQSLLKQPLGLVPSPQTQGPPSALKQISLSISSALQVPAKGAALPQNQFQATSFNKNNPISSSQPQQISTAREGISKFGQTPPQKPTPLSVLPNSADSRSPTPSSMLTRLPNGLNPLRPQGPVLPEPHVTPIKLAVSNNAPIIGRHATISHPSSSSNSRLLGFSGGQSLTYHLQANRNGHNTFPASRNEFMGEPELEQWSPENSPMWASDFGSDRNFNGRRQDDERSMRSDWPRHRRSGGLDHRMNSSRWRDRRR